MSEKSKNRNYKSGILINKAKKGKYNNPDAASKIKGYILGERGSSKENRKDIIHYGAYGAVDFLDTDLIIEQFLDVQKCHVRHCKNQRYADHEVFVFSEDDGIVLKRNPDYIPDITKKMASILSDGEFQTFYGVHDGGLQDDKYRKTNGKLHVHFLVNTVSFKTLKKRQDNFSSTAVHEKQLQALLKTEIAKIEQEHSGNP